MLWPRIESDEKLRFIYEQIELTEQVLYEMERTGVLIDRAKLEAQSRELGARIAELEAMSHELAGQPFNLGSPKQIGDSVRQALPGERRRAAHRRPTKRCLKNLHRITRCRSCCSSTADCRS